MNAFRIVCPGKCIEIQTKHRSLSNVNTHTQATKPRRDRKEASIHPSSQPPPSMWGSIRKSLASALMSKHCVCESTHSEAHIHEKSTPLAIYTYIKAKASRANIINCINFVTSLGHELRYIWRMAVGRFTGRQQRYTFPPTPQPRAFLRSKIA